MKRFSALLLCCLLAAALCACGAEKLSPYARYQAFSSQLREAPAVSARSDCRVALSHQGQSSENQITAEVLLVRTGEGLEMRLEHAVQFPGTKTTEEFVSYYRDKTFYQEDRALDYQYSVRFPESRAEAQIWPVCLAFSEDAVASSSQEKNQDGEFVSLTLSPEAAQEPLLQILLSVMDLSGFPESDGAPYSQPITSKVGDARLELRFDGAPLPAEAVLLFTAERQMDRDTLQFDCEMKLTDLKLEKSTAIVFPDDLAEYDAWDWGGEEDLDEPADPAPTAPPPAENRFIHIESDYEIINEVSDNCYASLFLEDAADSLDLYFWYCYQTQAGLSAPEHPTGFSSPADISAEGLVRLFCFLNEHQVGAFSDPELRLYYIPDPLVSISLDHFLEGYTYDPSGLPPEFGYTSTMLNMSYDLVQPAANLCRVERAEVLDPERVLLTATGLAEDGVTPRNRQELTLKIRSGGGVSFERYAISPA